MKYNDFEAIGLNENEAKAYMAILELGEALASRIAEKAGIKRTTVYLALRSLKNRDLIGQAKKNGQMRYFAEDPKILEKAIKERNEKFSRLIPQILAAANLIDRKPAVHYFEGPKSHQKVYEDILAYKKQGILALWPSYGVLSSNEYFLTNFNSQRLAAKIPIKTLYSGDIKDLKQCLELQKINQVRISPRELMSNQIEIYIYGQAKAGLISYAENFSVIIESRKIYGAAQGLFEALWRISRQTGT